jgi:hypothetical protein
MFAQQVTRHTSIRYSSSCHTRVNKGASIFFTVAMFRAFRSARSRGRTLHTVIFDIDSSLAAVPVDFFGLCRKLARTRSKSSSAVNGRPLDFCLHRHPVSVNCLYHARMVLSVRRVLCVLCTKCTLHSNHRLNSCDIPTHKTTYLPERPFSHYIHSHRLAAQM